MTPSERACFKAEDLGQKLIGGFLPQDSFILHLLLQIMREVKKRKKSGSSGPGFLRIPLGPVISLIKPLVPANMSDSAASAAFRLMQVLF